MHLICVGLGMHAAITTGHVYPSEQNYKKIQGATSFDNLSRKVVLVGSFVHAAVFDVVVVDQLN